jgi:hypothetical protein
MDPAEARQWSRAESLRSPPVLWSAAVLLAALRLAFFSSPLLAIGNLKLAAKRGDQPRLERLVDFPALRLSLKAQLAASLAAHPRHDGGLAAAVLLSDSFIDAVLTPQNLAALINGAAFLPRPVPDMPAPQPAAAGGVGGAPIPAPDPVMTVGPRPSDPAATQIQGGYAGFNRFEISIRRPGEPGATVFAFRRRGLLGWRLTDIRVPAQVLARIG